MLSQLDVHGCIVWQYSCIVSVFIPCTFGITLHYYVFQFPLFMVDFWITNVPGLSGVISAFETLVHVLEDELLLRFIAWLVTVEFTGNIM